MTLRAALPVLLLLAAGQAGAEPRVIFADEERWSRAEETVGRLLAGPPRKSDLSQSLLAGPRLAARLPPPEAGAEAVAITVVFRQPGIEAWDIPPLDLAGLPTDIREGMEALVAEQPDAIPVQTRLAKGKHRGPLVERSLALMGEAAASVRRPTPAELRYYWALIPHEIEEPLLVLERGGASLLLDFDASGKLFYLALLPPGLPRERDLRPLAESFDAAPLPAARLPTSWTVELVGLPEPDEPGWKAGRLAVPVHLDADSCHAGLLAESAELQLRFEAAAGGVMAGGSLRLALIADEPPGAIRLLVAHGSGDERVVEHFQAERLLTEAAGERTRARYEAGTPGLMIPPAWNWVGLACGD